MRTLIGLCLSIGALPAVFAQPQPLIDTHSHFQSGPNADFEASLQAALDVMDRFGVQTTILMPPPLDHAKRPRFYDIEDLEFARSAHRGRVALMGGSSLNVMIHETPADAVSDGTRAQFRQRAETILGRGAVGFGEIGIHHVSIPAMGAQHPYENVPSTHPLLLLLADIAAERDVPIDLHFDLAPEDMPLPPHLRPNMLNPRVLKENERGFRALLSHNPRTRFVWSHVGFEPLFTRLPDQVRQFLKDFPNLYMSFRLNSEGPTRPPRWAWMAASRSRGSTSCESFPIASSLAVTPSTGEEGSSGGPVSRELRTCGRWSKLCPRRLPLQLPEAMQSESTNSRT